MSHTISSNVQKAMPSLLYPNTVYCLTLLTTEETGLKNLIQTEIKRTN